MIDPVLLAAFVPAALLLNLTPGADMVFCLGQGLRAGTRAGVAASAGISAGVLVHVALAGLGLGAAVAAAPWLFEAIRWAGVAYLLWLAVGALRVTAPVARPVVPASARRAFRDGFAVNLMNPKVILFVLAFVPQFVDTSRGPVLIQFLMLGAVIAVGGFAINALVGVFAGRIGGWITRSNRVSRGLGAATAAIFTALAVRLAFLERA
ncbi:LysE family translocator [Roseovarius salinarum]|uniref:LysE family translocator n=1 Tax=Roseovarius salinarum TaxID=1981892 RepID=UPI000C34C57B|nr:LysE family translocator [Roseovarius salinarum]